MRLGINKVSNTIKIDKKLLKRIKEVSKKHKITQVSIYEKGVEMYLEKLEREGA